MSEMGYVDLEALEKELDNVYHSDDTVPKHVIHIVEKRASKKYEGLIYIDIIGEFFLNDMGCLADVFEPIKDDVEYYYSNDKLRSLDDEYGNVILEADLEKLMNASLEMIERGEGDIVFFLIWNSMHDYIHDLDPMKWENVGVLYCPLLDIEVM